MKADWKPVDENTPDDRFLLVKYDKKVVDADQNWVWPAKIPMIDILKICGDGFYHDERFTWVNLDGDKNRIEPHFWAELPE